jgi:hypothetical protein
MRRAGLGYVDVVQVDAGSFRYVAWAVGALLLFVAFRVVSK